MSWYDVYDNVEVQRVTRTQAAAITVVVTIVLLVSMTSLALGMDGPLPTWLGISTAVMAWVLFGMWILRRRRRLRRVVWCIKLSIDEIVGYDYARRPICMLWTDVERIDVDGGSMTIVGPNPASLEITHLFPDFAQVSHRVMHYADLFGIPVFVDGRPWQQIDIYHLFPFLSAERSC